VDGGSPKRGVLPIDADLLSQVILRAGRLHGKDSKRAPGCGLYEPHSKALLINSPPRRGKATSNREFGEHGDDQILDWRGCVKPLDRALLLRKPPFMHS
jgi:hypothetical protein